MCMILKLFGSLWYGYNIVRQEPRVSGTSGRCGYTHLCIGPLKIVSGTAAQRNFHSADLPLSGISAQTTSSGWYFKSLKYLYVAKQVGLRVSSSVPDGSCGRVKHLQIVSLGCTSPDRLAAV